jgi:hypothetical protein
LGILTDEAGDYVLLSDLVAAEGSWCFQSIPPLEDGDHFQFLLSIVTAVSDHQLCRMPLRLFVMISRLGIHQHFFGLIDSSRRPPRTVLFQLMGGADILMVSEVRIWRKGTVHCTLPSNGCCNGETVMAHWGTFSATIPVNNQKKASGVGTHIDKRSDPACRFHFVDGYAQVS